MMDKIIILLLLFNNCFMGFGKQCYCNIYSKTLIELNKEFDNSFRPFEIYSIIDTTFNSTDINSIKFDTAYYSTFYQHKYKFYISDKITENYYCKSFVDFIDKQYFEISNDSSFKIFNYSKASKISLYNCKFANVDSIKFLKFNDANFIELKNKVNSDYSYNIIPHKNHNDTIGYTPIIIYFSEIVFCNKHIVFFNINYTFSNRQFSRSVFFRKEKNKWKFYKFGNVSTF